MPLPLSGTMSVTNGLDTFAWTGAPLTKLNCVQGATVVVGGVTYFIGAEPSDTTQGVFSRAYAGANDAAAPAEISQLSPDQVRVGELNKRAAEVMSQLSVLDANGRGLFYNLIGLTGDNDPGPGRMAFDSVDPSAVTRVFLDVLDANDGGRDVTPLIDLWPAGTIVVVRSLVSAAYAAYRLTATAEVVAGYRRLLVTFVGSAGALAAEPVAIEWRLAGADKDSDATVNALAGRAAFDGQPSGFRVFVNDTGAGRAARYTKLSNASADWSAPAYFTGAQSVTPGPIGVNWRGAWNNVDTYAARDAVRNNRSSWRSLQDGNTNHPPPLLPAESDAWWELMAGSGLNGTGTGDMVGPAGAVPDRLVVFDGLTGKLVKDGGKTIAELLQTPGMCGDFAMTSAPAGWLKANGATISRSTYAALFANIGTTFGAGDGSTTFKLPDLRGEFVRGLDDGRGVDSGRTLGTSQTGLVESHRHTTMRIEGFTGNEPASIGSDASPYYTIAGNTGTSDTTLFGGAETRPRNVALLACIKY